MDAKRALLQFRNKEFPSIAKSYFLTRLRKSLDFFNAFSEGAESDPSLADFHVVKSSKQLKERVQAAIKYVKREARGDIVQGLYVAHTHTPSTMIKSTVLTHTLFLSRADVASSGSEFKAARFIARRGQGMYQDMGESDIINVCLDFSDPASNPNLLPTTPLQSPLPLPDSAVRQPSLRPRKASDASSDLTIGSSDGSVSDASSTCSVETTQSSVVAAEESSSAGLHDAKESVSEASIPPAEEEGVSTVAPAAEENPDITPTASSSSMDSSMDSSSSHTDDARTAMTSASGVVATRRKMNCVTSQDTQTAYFVVQNSGNWLQHLLAKHAKGAQQLESALFDSPIILAAAMSPLQAPKPDGMMRVYFMSQARKQQDGEIRDENGRVVHARKGGDSVREWVVGSAKISTHALTMHLGKQLDKKNARLLPAASPAVRKVDSVVGPNNRLIEMTAAPDIPQAVLISTPHPVEDVREGDIVEEERDDGFVHIETHLASRAVEVVPDATPGTDKEGKEDKRPSKAKKKPRSKGKQPAVKKNTSKTATTKTDTGAAARVDVKIDIAVDATSVPPRKPQKVYTPPFSRKSWRDVESQEPQVVYDVTHPSGFFRIEEVQVFSFSTSSHDMMPRTAPAAAPAAAAVEEGEGIGVWAPPVVGIFSWMWDHLTPGGWAKTSPVR